MSLLKSPKDLSLIRQAGKKLGEVLGEAKKQAKPGVKLLDLDTKIHQHIISLSATPSFLGFDGFPNSSCLSLNSQVVHGITDDRILKEGDILGIDVGLWFQGVCVDAAITVGIGAISEEAANLLACTKQALELGIKAAKPYTKIGSISHAIQSYAEAYELGIVRALTGHGVGHAIHEPPPVPNFGRLGDGATIRPGMVLAIEPMLTLGGGDVVTENDGWGIVTADNSLAAQFEHTVIITNRGAEIVTQV